MSPEEGPGGSQLGVLRARLGQLYSSPGLGLGGEGGRSHPSPSWELCSQTGPRALRRGCLGRARSLPGRYMVGASGRCCLAAQ